MKETSKVSIDQELIEITKQLLVESGETSKREIRLDASLQRHLGIDSLSRAELFQRIGKKFDADMPDRLLAEAETLNDIAAYLQHKVPGFKSSIQLEVVKSHGERPHVDPMNTKTLIDVIQLYGEKAPDKAHIYFQNEDGKEDIITYGDLLKHSLQVANGLRALGLKDGETVAIMQPTQPGFFYTFMGTLLAGGVPVPIYPPFRMHMLEAYAKMEARILKSAEVRIMVTFDQAENLSRLLKTFVPSLKHVTTVDDLIRSTILTTPFHAKSDNFAFIQYTSGSTSDPKGVLLTHHNLLSNVRAYGKAIDVKPDDVAVSWLPLYHDLGLIGMWLGSLYHGVPLVLMTPFSFLNRPERWLWTIHRHRGTLSGAPNFAYELCIKKIDPALLEGLDLSSWRMAANGAEKVYARTLDDFANKFAPYGFKRNALFPVYGLAESTVGLALPPVGREFKVDNVDRQQFEETKHAIPSTNKNALAFVSCGKAIDGHEIRIVDENDKEMPERYVGSLQFRGPSNMQGYYNNPTATQAVYHDGWLDSGDLAYQAEGEIYITGRRKDLIIKAGRNLYPAEIEEMVGNVPGIRQGCVAAFGTTDPVRGTEQLIVVAETKEKGRQEREAIVAAVNEKLSSMGEIVPDHVVLVAPRTVPKTSSGKLQRAACKTMYVEGRLKKWQVPAWLQVVKLGAQGLWRQLVSGLVVCGKAIYTIYAVLLTILTAFPVYLVIRFAPHDVAAKIARYWARGLLTILFCPVRISGGDKLKEKEPVIFAANHASYLDAIVALAIISPGTRIVAKRELFTAPIMRTVMKNLDYLAIDRLDLSKGLEDTKQIERTLQEGHSVFIFPEGTFGYASGLRPFRLGAFKIAAETGFAVCPVAIKGTRSILRGNEKLMSPSRISITVCSPIKAAGSEWQHVTQLRDTVRAEIANYCGESSLDFIAANTIASGSRP